MASWEFGKRWGHHREALCYRDTVCYMLQSNLLKIVPREFRRATAKTRGFQRKSQRIFFKPVLRYRFFKFLVISLPKRQNDYVESLHSDFPFLENSVFPSYIAHRQRHRVVISSKIHREEALILTVFLDRRVSIE